LVVPNGSRSSTGTTTEVLFNITHVIFIVLEVVWNSLVVGILAST
jgi:hypothetical protein